MTLFPPPHRRPASTLAKDGIFWMPPERPARATAHLAAGDWLPVDPASAIQFFLSLGRAAPSGGLKNLIDDVAVLRCIDRLTLPFYKDACLISIEVETLGGEVGALDIFINPHVAHVVTGSAAWLHLTNANDLLLKHGHFRQALAGEPLAALYAAYLRFHNGVIWADHGPFRVIEDPMDPLLEASRRRRPEWTPPVHPLEIRLTSDESCPAEATATVLYGGDLFRTDFRLHASGIVEMVSDDALCKNLVEPWVTRVPLRQVMLVR